MRALLLAPLVLAGACSAPPTFPEPPPAVRAEVVAALAAYYDALSDRDWEAFAACFWPDATITTVWQPKGEPAPRVFASTIPEFVEKAPEGPGSQPIFEERMTAVEVRVHGNLAQAWAGYDAAFGDEQQLMRWSGVDGITLLEHDGTWKITSIAFASDR